MNRHVEDRARRQHGAITHAQLCDYGIGPATLRSMLRRRQLVVVHRGVYRLAAFEATPWLRAAAAVLATAGSFRAAKNGPHRVAVSHRTAARLWEYITAGEMTGVEVLGGRGWRVVGLHVHRMPLADDDVVILRGVPVTSPARTILDLAGCATPRELEQALPWQNGPGAPSPPFVSNCMSCCAATLITGAVASCDVSSPSSPPPDVVPSCCAPWGRSAR